jgi:YHS domain-containing protein
MTKLILWVVLAGFLLRALSRLVRGILEGAGYHRGGAVAPSVGLVRDPVCGVFVVPAQALTAGAGRETKYFCSEKCRQQWGRRS